MKNNKYLKELGLKWYDLPGNYNKKLEENERLCDTPAADIRNKEDKEGFCGYEFFSLDYSLALYIYPRLCFFRDHIATIGTPGCFSSITDTNKTEGSNLWQEIVGKMCEAFKLIITGEAEENGIAAYKVREGLHLFAEYYSNLWY